MCLLGWTTGEVLKLRLLLGPLGALNPAGPRGGDFGAGARTRERSRGVDRAESRSLYARLAPGGDRGATGGERALGSFRRVGIAFSLLGCT